MKLTYLIDYVIYDTDNQKITEGEYKVKNQFSSTMAKLNFEKFLRRKHPKFGRVVFNIVKSLGETKKPFDMNDIMSGNKFNDIFGGGFPGGFGGRK